MRARIISIAAVILCLAANIEAGPWPGHAFDGDREGLTFGIGLGGGLTHISSTNGELSDSIDKGTFGITYRMGYAPNERLEIHAFYRASVYGNKLWEHWDDIASKDDSSKGFTHALLLPIVPFIAMFTDQHLLVGFGATYYLASSTHAWFLELGGGPSILSDPWELDGPSPFPGGVQTGYGVLGGIGYEFAQHVQLHLELMWSRAAWESSGIDKSWMGTSVLFSIGLVGY